MKKSCKSCEYYLVSEEKGKGNCLVDPPKVQFMPVEVPENPRGAIAAASMPKMTVRILPFSGLPFVREIDFCRFYSAQDEGTRH